MSLTVSDIIASASLVIATFSVMYARHSVNLSKKSNKIAIHTERLKVLDRVLELEALLSTKGPRISKEEIEIFKNTVLISELYFDAEICKELHHINDLANELLKVDVEWSNRDKSKPDDHFELHAVRYGLCHKIQNVCGFLSKKMKQDMQLNSG